jgi:DNA-binding IclR family transcriptional regulator
MRPHAARRLHAHLCALPEWQLRHQTPRELAQALGCSLSWLYRCLGWLESSGCVTVERPTREYPWWVVQVDELRGATLAQVIRYARERARR